jgi:hypothetical protein
MSEQVVQLAGPQRTGWRVFYFMLAAAGFANAWFLWAGGRFPVELVAIFVAGGIFMAAVAVLLDDTETWVRADTITFRRRNLLRTVTHTAPVADVKGIGTRAEWLGQLFRLNFAVVPLTWSVAIDIAGHGRINSGPRITEQDAAALERRVRRILGW